MYKATICGLVILVFGSSAAWATCSSYPNTLTNGTTADASQVMANFNCAALTSGATIDSTTFTGITTFPSSTVVDSSGKVGIGMTPSNILDITQSQNGSTNAGLTNGTSGTSAIARYIVNAGTAYSEFWAVSQGFTSSGLVLAGSTQIRAGGAMVLKTDTSNPIIFGINGSEDVRIASSGAVGIGTTTPSYTLHVNGSVAGTSAYNNLSDARLKKDVSPIRDALAIIGQLQGVRFQWRSPEDRTIGKQFNLPIGQPQVGFIAQNVKSVLPEAVSVAKDQDATMSVAESKVVPVLVEALKELKAANDNQSVEIRDLQSQVSKLEKKIGIRTALN